MECERVVHLNVGGTLFVTDETTLKKDAGSKLANLRKGQKGSGDSERCHFIDRDGKHFSHILQYLRDGTIPPADVAVQVHKEAKFYGLAALVERLEMVGPVHEEIIMEKLRSEIPDYKQNLDKIINIARRKFLQRNPAKPTTEVWIGTRYDHDDAPFHASAHACEFQPQYNSQDISAENTVSLIFTGQKDAVHYTIRENLPTIIHHDLTELKFKFVLSHLVTHQHSTPQQCKICLQQYKERLQATNAKNSFNLSANLSDKGFGILAYCVTFTWFEKAH